MMHTDLLFNSPRIRFSRQAMEAVLSFARALGAKNVPTYYAWKQFHEGMQERMGTKTRAVLTQGGNILHFNSIIDSIGMASPLFQAVNIVY